MGPEVDSFQVSNFYNIPVTNRFQLLEVDKESQVSTDNGSNDASTVDRASVPSPITIDILMVHKGEGQSSHVLVIYDKKFLACKSSLV